jgi:uncharacterized damage-inducible protein DinB
VREVDRILDQLARAFEGEAWHGPPLRRLLDGVNATTARVRPISEGHSIWELVRHIQVWEDVVARRLEGEVIAGLPPEQDWPAVTSDAESEWKKTVGALEAGNRRLRDAIARFSDERLPEVVPARGYTFYVMLHGIVQHDLYHAGQIALLKKAVRSSGR